MLCDSWPITESPQINPFVLAGEPAVGREFLVHCIVIAGDFPIDLIWYKDGQPIVPARLDSSPQSLGNSHVDRHERSHSPEELCRSPLPMEAGILSNGADDTASGAFEVANEKNRVDPRIVVNQLGDRYSELRFTALCPFHSGNYTCVATNMVGSAAYSDTLYVRGKFRHCCMSNNACRVKTVENKLLILSL